MARGVEVRTKSARGAARRQRQSEIRSSPVYAGCKIKPLEKLAFLQYVSTRAPAVSDRIEAIRQAEGPLPHSTDDGFSSLSSNPYGRPERNDLLPCGVFGMRARTCQLEASTPGSGSLPSLDRLAKGKIQTRSPGPRPRPHTKRIRYDRHGAWIPLRPTLRQHQEGAVRQAAVTNVRQPSPRVPRALTNVML